MKFLRTIAAPIAALAIGASTLVTPAALANPAVTVETAERSNSDRTWRAIAEEHGVEQLDVNSPAMERKIPLAVIKAEQPNAPTLYLLNGAGGAEQNMDWLTRYPELVKFYRGKGVNVVIPQEGAFSYYIDWANPNPGNSKGYLGGKQLWETFLTKELPDAIEGYLGAGDKRAIAGFSMSATSSLLLAEKNPGFYAGVGSFSGCAETSSFIGYKSAELTVNRAGSNVVDMLGPMGSEHNRANDALIHAEGLRDTELYISNATGLAGEYDMPGYYTAQGVNPAEASAGAATLIVEGGAIEAATNICTHNLKAKLDNLGIEADWNLRPTGTHSWNYWIEDVTASWPTLERALF
ncbi:S-formylglutathione hydrolase FrmB [Corynebacterium pollutisoli]|uniref:S-formylglutathione hydrolase FrmB n=1 Tax=Corynebacterium pollutisoli TaxID=1610489 RepID=A0A1X7IIB9_9CORY|nr:alpha/beta hydrolase family protein [Corynebacterium pollutisoli]SMG14617.1 S-formylglutathione hydrolase FrmB [Corynebacterium pollutisoli]